MGVLDGVVIGVLGGVLMAHTVGLHDCVIERLLIGVFVGVFSFVLGG